MFGKRIHKLLDIGVQGKMDHINKYALAGATVVGIAGEEFYGPLRIFKRESDQTNKSGAKTTDEDRIDIQRVAFLELAQASSLVPGDGGDVDIYAAGMSPISDMLQLLSLTRPT
jgi:hypothetical protein